MVACVMSSMIERGRERKMGSNIKQKMVFFFPLRVYSHLGKNLALSTFLLNYKKNLPARRKYLFLIFLEYLFKDQSFNPLWSKKLGSDHKILNFDFIKVQFGIYM